MSPALFAIRSDALLDFRTRHDTNAYSLEAVGLAERQFTSASAAKLPGRNIPSSGSPPSWLYQRRRHRLVGIDRMRHQTLNQIP